MITGTTKTHTLSDDVLLAAKSNATIVILMGMSKLSQIVRIFVAQNKKDIPVAIIQNGTKENEQVGFGTIETIEEVVNHKKLSSPAIIIIGEVVNQRSTYLYSSHFASKIEHESINQIK